MLTPSPTPPMSAVAIFQQTVGLISTITSTVALKAASDQSPPNSPMRSVAVCLSYLANPARRRS